MNILISGVWGTNKGDRAIATFLVEKLHQNSKVEKIYISTNDTATLKKYMPEYVEIIDFGYLSKNKFERIYFKLIAFPILRNRLLKNKKKKLRFVCFKKYKNILSKVDYVVMTGGHHITSMREKDSIHPLTYDLGLINLYGLKYCLWSQTIGPLEFKESKNKCYIQKILEDAERIFIRDNNSIEVLNEIHKGQSNISRSYDSVFGLKNVFSNQLAYSYHSDTIGISIFYSNYKTSDQINSYINRITEICKYILEKKYKVKFFPMETDNNEIEIIRNIMYGLSSEMVSIENTNIKTIDHLKKINDCAMFIGHKTHSVIMSLTLGVPLIALCYHMKTYDFMSTFNMEEFTILDKDYTFNEFKQKFDNLCLNQVAIRTDLKETSKKISEKVNNDFERFLSNE